MEVKYSVDAIGYKENEDGKRYFYARGWVFSTDDSECKIVTYVNGKKCETECVYHVRMDVVDKFKKYNIQTPVGFKIRTELTEDYVENIQIKVTDHENSKVMLNLNESRVARLMDENSNNRLATLMDKNRLRTYVNSKTGGSLMNGFRILKSQGPKGVYKMLTTGPYSYDSWTAENFATEKTLEKQREYKFDYSPLISIVIPLYKTKHEYLKELLDTILDQSYHNLELCLADGSPTDELKDFIEELYPYENRIKYKHIDDNYGISGNTNEAIYMAEGEYIMFTDHDDLLLKNALFEMVKAINKDRSIDAIYTDEDIIDFDGKKTFGAHLKPDFNIDFLRNVNYICHIFMVKKELADSVSETVDGKKIYLRSEYDGAQDYDFVLRCVEKAETIHHVPEVLYRWRSHKESTASGMDSKSYALEAGRKAIEAHYKRVGIEADVTLTKIPGTYRSKYKVIGEPLVSILIPSKDHISDLDKCVNSIFERSTYKNYEIIIIENNSVMEETFEYYEELQEKHDNVKVVEWEDEFNYSAINNFGAKAAKGEYYILLNNDTEVISRRWIEEMLGYCQREDVGIVGAKLFFPDDTVQHCGVVVGFGGTAGHVGIGMSRYDIGYMAWPCTPRDISAVTAACLMIDAKVYEEVGGLDEKNFKVAFNDVDLCLKVGKAGYLNVYNPYVELYHYESKSRGYENTPEKAKRFNREQKRLRAKWRDIIIENGDPYYNKNLSLVRADYSLKRKEDRMPIF